MGIDAFADNVRQRVETRGLASQIPTQIHTTNLETYSARGHIIQAFSLN